jgi:hypothetical protein
MRNRIDIDPKHSRAIVQQIGERLAAFMKEEPELPASLRAQIDRLREFDCYREVTMVYFSWRPSRDRSL